MKVEGTRSSTGQDDATPEVNKVKGQLKDKTETREGLEVANENKTETKQTEVKTGTKSVQNKMKDTPQGKQDTMKIGPVPKTNETGAEQVSNYAKETKPVQDNDNVNNPFQTNGWSEEGDVQEVTLKIVNPRPLQTTNEVSELVNGVNGEIAKKYDTHNGYGELVDGMAGGVSIVIEGETTGQREEEVRNNPEELKNAEYIIPEINISCMDPGRLNGHASESERENFQERDEMKNTEEVKDEENGAGLLKVEECDSDDTPKRKITLGDLNIVVSELECENHELGQAEPLPDETDEAVNPGGDLQQRSSRNTESKQNEVARDAKQEERDEPTKNRSKHRTSDSGQSQDATFKNKTTDIETNLKNVPSETERSDENDDGLKENGNTKQKPGNRDYDKQTEDENQEPERQNHAIENQRHREQTISVKPDKMKTETTSTAAAGEAEAVVSSPEVDEGAATETDWCSDGTEDESQDAWEESLNIDMNMLLRLLPFINPVLLPRALQPQNSPNSPRGSAKNSLDMSLRQSRNSLNVIQESLEDERSDPGEKSKLAGDGERKAADGGGKKELANGEDKGKRTDGSNKDRHLVKASVQELPTKPPHPSLASFRRHSFHHFPVPPPESNSKKAERVRALLQAVEEQELEKISKRLGDKSGLVRQHLGHVESRLFEMFGDKDKETININKFLMGLTATGMRPTDPRLKQTRDNIKKLQDKLGTEFVALEVDYDTFMSIISENLEVVVRAFSASFVIPDFQGFCKQIEEIYNICYTNHSGKPAQYIPQLARFSSKRWGMSVCTVDGQRFSLGDVDVPFTIQSCSKPLTYAIGLALNGTDYIHKYVGMEPSGRYFNELVLDYNNKPHNPMINSGAIMTAAIIKPELSAADRFDYMFKVYKRLAGDEYLGFNNSVFLSERECADRNFALAYFMRENKCFPQNHKMHESLDFYFQLCSMEITAESGAVMAATLANGGLNPLTGDPVLTVDAVRNTLTLMHSCGMYNYSGQFAFQVGLPAKSGVSGCVLLVVPNTMGICLWSPPLDSNGNSCRGVQFCMEMVSRFSFHNFDNLRGYAKPKQDPRIAKTESKAQILFDLLFSAAAGDISALRRHSLAGTDMQAKDYDGRTALHVATSEGHHEVVDFLLNRCNVYPLPKDRWDRTPLDDAESFDHPKCSRLLSDCCKKRGIEIPISYKDFAALNDAPSGSLVTMKSS